jgi:hypothetical protein
MNESSVLAAAISVFFGTAARADGFTGAFSGTIVGATGTDTSATSGSETTAAGNTGAGTATSANETTATDTTGTTATDTTGAGTTTTGATTGTGTPTGGTTGTETTGAIGTGTTGTGTTTTGTTTPTEIIPPVAVLPPAPPSLYDQGPTSFQVSATDVSAAERAADALYESVLQATEARVLATGCAALVGAYEIKTFANGATGSPASNETMVTSPGGTLALQANLTEADSFRGQQIKVNQPANGSLSGTAINGFDATLTFNKPGTIMVGDSTVNVVGVNGKADPFPGRVIKDFYRATNAVYPDYRYVIFDWGLQAVLKRGYPVEKYWQRSVALRDDGGVGHTVFVKDRLVGATSCRLVLDTTGANNAAIFNQSGKLTVSQVKPSDAAGELELKELAGGTTAQPYTPAGQPTGFGIQANTANGLTPAFPALPAPPSAPFPLRLKSRVPQPAGLAMLSARVLLYHLGQSASPPATLHHDLPLPRLASRTARRRRTQPDSGRRLGHGHCWGNYGGSGVRSHPAEDGIAAEATHLRAGTRPLG